MRDNPERLRDILEAISRIERYAGAGTAAFDHNELIQNWVIHYLQIIGEASARLSATLQAQYPEVPWPKIIGMRHILVHDYFDIDLDIVKAVLDTDLPVLKGQIQAILEKLESG